jgi:tetratricopeptide (TPR) repeat protein
MRIAPAAVVAAMVVSFAAAAAARAQTPAAGTSASADAARASLLSRAAAAQKAGRDDEAAALFRSAGDKFRSVHAYLALARLEVRARQLQAAMTTLGKARALAPNSEEVLDAFSQLALTVKQPMPAVIALQALTRMCPAVAPYHYRLGVGLMAIGDMPGAADALAEADRLEPERPLTLLALGLARINRKEFADAKIALTRSLDLDPESAEAIAALAEAEAGLGEYDAAAARAGAALERAPGSATAHLVMGLVKMERRDYAGARDALLKAAAADPESAKAIYQLSLVYARLGEDATAAKYVEQYQAKLREQAERIRELRAGGVLKPPPDPAAVKKPSPAKPAAPIKKDPQ